MSDFSNTLDNFKPLTEEYLDEMLLQIKQLIDDQGKVISIRPTKVFIDPSWTRKQVEAHLRAMGREDLIEQIQYILPA